MATLSNLQTYTPGSDIAAAFQPNQLIWGRTGNDVVLGYSPVNPLPGESTLDILIGDIELPQLVDPFPRTWRDKFILGDWKKPYYSNGNPFSLGLNDLAIIIDFNPANDIIQLHGGASDYQTFDFFNFGTVIWHKQEILPGIVVPDVVSIVLTPDLDLNASYFQYVGSAPAAPSLPNSKQLGTEGYEIGFGITSDRYGNVYVVGGTSGDLGGSNQGNRDVWFAKYDSSGNEIWRNQFGSTSFDFAFGIGVDQEGNIYITGTTEGNLFNTKFGEVSDSWLAKFDNNGNAIWQKQFGNDGFFTHNSYAIDVDAVGNVSISGVSVKNTAEGAILPTTGDAWVSRFDINGNQQWFQQFGTPNDPVAYDESYAIALDKEGNVFTAGFTTGAIGSTPYNGLYDAWLSKNDKNGNQLWAKNIGTTDYDWAWGVDTDSQGNAYVTGWTLGNLSGINAGSFDAWLAKFDKDGNQLWVHQFGTSGDDEAFAVKVDSHDNVYVTGYTDGAFTGKTNKGDFDAWVAKFDPLGNQQWIQQFGTAGTEQAYDLTVSGSNVYVTGITDGSLGTANQGSFDAWVVKLNGENGNIENFTGTLDSYIQPQKQGSEILASAHNLGQFNQSPTSQTDELFTLVPKDVDLVQLATNAIARVFNTTPDALANYSSLQNLLSANLTPYGGVFTPYGEVGITSLDPTNQLLTLFSNVDLNSLLLPSDQPSIFNLPTPNYSTNGVTLMSLFTLLTTNPRLVGTLDITATFGIETPLGTIGISNSARTDINQAIPFSLSLLPDIRAGNSGNNQLDGNSSSFSELVTIPDFSVNINYPSGPFDDDTFPYRVPLEYRSFPVTNTPRDFLVGFGGNDVLRGFGGEDVLIGDGLTPNEQGLEGLDGADTLEGGDGNDVIIGGGAGDNISGGNDDDFILGDYFLGLTNASIPINLDRLFSDSGSIGRLTFLGIPLASGSYNANLSARFGPDSIDLGSGNEGNDTISGGNGNDTIISDRGNDLVNGDAGDDIILGAANDDTLNGGSDNDVIFGDSFAPNFYGPDGNDSLDGGSGNDVLVGGGLGDTLRGGDGNDVLLGDYFLGFISGTISLNDPNNPFRIPSNIPLQAGDQFDLITIQLFNTSLSIGSGNEGNDLLSGGNGNDIAIGDKGNDTIFGEAGNDVGIGGAGNDVISGGTDNDVILGDFLSPNFQGGLDGVDTLSGDSGNDTIIGGGFGDSISGGDGDDILLGDYFLGLLNTSIPIPINLGNLAGSLSVSPSGPQPNTIYLPIGSGNEGNDTISGGNGNDVIIGDKGFDSLSGDGGDDFILGGADADTITGGAGADILIGDLLSPNAYGADGVDNLDGGDGADVVIGGGLGDLINGGAGNDFLLGDYFLGLPVTSPITIDLSGNNTGSFQLPNINIPIGSGNEGNDTINAGAGDDIAIGDKGNDILNGDIGNDILLGGGDNDTITGGAGDDIISGDYLLPQGTTITLPPEVRESLSQFLTLPQSGELTIDIGPAGDDLLDGGAGNDIISGDNGNDTVTYANDPSGVIVSLGSIFNPGLGTAFDGYGGFDTLLSIENVIGSAFNDQITGDAIANIIRGGNGNDTIAGGAGNDSLFGEEGNDVISGDEGDDFIVGGKGGDFLNGGAGIDTASYAESDFGVVVDLDIFFGLLGGAGFSGDARGDVLFNIENLEGSEFVDRLEGDGFNNKIDGLGGADQIFGEGGNDTLGGQGGDDIINGGDGNDQIFGNSGMDNLFGDAGDDEIRGGDDFDELTGGLGNDRLFGEDGNDRLFGGDGDDQLFGGNGNDTIEGNSGIDYLVGGEGADNLLGQDGNDILQGENGNDTLVGGNGDDVLEGGTGIDNLSGGAGKDLFVFAAGAGTDTIFDFQDGQDILGLKNSLTFGQLAVVQGTGINANNTLISIQASGELLATLIGVEANTLTVQDFVSV